MPRYVVIDFDSDQNDPTDFNVWIFAEDLYRAFEDDDWVSFPLEDVDGARRQIRMLVRSKRRISRACTVIEDLLRRQSLMDRAHISVVNFGS